MPLLSAPKTRVCKLEVARQKKIFFLEDDLRFLPFSYALVIYISTFIITLCIKLLFSIIYITITYYSVNLKMLDVMNVATLCIDPERDQERFRQGRGLCPRGAMYVKRGGGIVSELCRHNSVLRKQVSNPQSAVGIKLQIVNMFMTQCQ